MKQTAMKKVAMKATKKTAMKKVVMKAMKKTAMKKVAMKAMKKLAMKAMKTKKKPARNDGGDDGRKLAMKTMKKKPAGEILKKYEGEECEEYMIAIEDSDFVFIKGAAEDLSKVCLRRKMRGAGLSILLHLCHRMCIVY